MPDPQIPKSEWLDRCPGCGSTDCGCLARRATPPIPSNGPHVACRAYVAKASPDAPRVTAVTVQMDQFVVLHPDGRLTNEHGTTLFVLDGPGTTWPAPSTSRNQEGA